MAMPSVSLDRPSARALHRSQDVASPARTAFDLVCEVEKWPVWLSFVRSARRLEPAEQIALGSEIAVRSNLIPGEDEELFEVDRYIPGHQLSLVGAFSVRRRIDIRIEQKSERSKLVVRVDYPTYGGMLGALVDRLTRRRKLDIALNDSLIHFKGLCEFDHSPDAILDDF
ncbi:MAG: SRPBCC family protein [Candidatus Eremiobacteraeota bacterium]|nr:SRPBCC family protein [Candidatus Eremiobacteraeota bacterium]